MRTNRGFTLAEIVVAMAIVTVLGAIIVLIFSNTLRGSNKSQILAVIKQNGQAVLENMDKTIRNSDNVVCPSLAAGDTLVVVKDGVYTRFKFIAPAPSSVPTVNGKIQQDAPVQPSPPALESDIKFFIENVCTDPLVDPVTLTDTNPQSGVSVGNFLFTRNRQSGSKENISVSFTLSPGVEAIAGQVDPVTFQTTVQLR